MIYNQWYAILQSRDVKTNQPLGLKRCGEDLVLWRDESGQVTCLPDRCTHRGAPLSLGRIHQGCLECPYHGLQFNTRGECQLIPANGKGKPIPRGFHLAVRTVREAHGFIWLWWGEARDSLPELPWFDEVPGDFQRMSTLSMEWKASFQRVVEGFLDAHHVPFAHRKVIPIPPVVEPFEAEFQGDTLKAWGCYKKDGAAPSENTTRHRFSYELRLPATAMLKFTPRAWILYVAAPITDTSTWVGVRYYHAYTRQPLLRRLISWYVARFDLKHVHPDDQRITEGMTLHETGEPDHLVPADKAILLWLKRRAELQKQSPPPRRTSVP